MDHSYWPIHLDSLSQSKQLLAIVNVVKIVLSSSGTLQLRYNLGGLQEPFTVDLDQRNLANGQPHSVNITRIERDIHVQVSENSILSLSCSLYCLSMSFSLHYSEVFDFSPVSQETRGRGDNWALFSVFHLVVPLRPLHLPQDLVISPRTLLIPPGLHHFPSLFSP